jgi:hypothetical protein
MGVVVAIDSYYGRRVYTVDDSTGVCIECEVMITTTAATTGSAGSDTHNSRTATSEQAEPAQSKVYDISEPAGPYADIDVGMVVDVKGNLKLFRNKQQIKIKKMQRVRSTNKEVQFWNKIEAFKKDVLSQPWVVERRELRKLEKQNKGDADSKGRKRKKQRKAQQLEQQQQQQPQKPQKEKHSVKAQEPSNYRSRADYGGSGSGSASSSSGSGLKKQYKPSKLRSVTTADEQHYDALGL